MILLAFDSTQQALRAEMLLEYADIDIDTLPTPKAITAGCALSIAFAEEALERVKAIILEQQVQIRGMYVQDETGYKLIWEGGERA